MSLLTHASVADGKTHSDAPSRSIAVVSPRHPDGSDWPWLSQIGAMRRHKFAHIYIQNTFKPFPKATRAYVRWQYWQAMRKISGADLACLFSTDINVGMTQWPSRWMRGPRRLYVGFTQDGPWAQPRIDRLARAMRQLEGVTVISQVERNIHIDRYGLDPARVHVVHLHTDETDGYDQYRAAPPMDGPYVLSIGLPNRRFLPIARACRELNIPLVIITRPTYNTESLEEIAALGARVVTDADKVKSFSYLRHARFPVFCFQSPELPGAITTIIHANFMGRAAIASDSLGLDEYIETGETGLVTPHHDDDALGSAIGRMWKDQDRCDQMGKLAQERAGRMYSLETAAARFADVFETVLASDRAG